MTHKAVIGTQWGDEGKGKIIDLLAGDADYVIRFAGGDNAGHTIIHKDKFVLHLIPSSILHENCINVIGNGVVVNPETLYNEIRALQERNIKVEPSNLQVSCLSHVITPYHILEDIIEEISSNIGTTLRGISPTYKDKVTRKGLLMYEFVNLDEKELEERLEKKKREIVGYAEYKGITPKMILGWVNDKEARSKMLKNFLEKYFSRFDFVYSGKILESLIDLRGKIKNFVQDTSLNLWLAHLEGKSFLFEGAQGFLLDFCFGSYRYVTPSNTGVAGIASGTGVYVPIKTIYSVAKSFTTRVGEGPFPTEIFDATADIMASDGTEFGATTGRKRRIGWFDSVLASYSTRINNANALVITKLDRLDELDKIKICTAYDFEGQVTKHVVPIASVLEKCTPVYEVVDGWKALTKGIKDYKELPENAKRYITRIEELVGTQVKIIGTGPAREDIIIR